MGWILLALIVGAVLGITSEAYRWRRNADAIQRIESAGQLYKVTRMEGQ